MKKTRKTGLLAIVIGITLIFAFTACLDVVKDIAGEETYGWSSSSTSLSNGVRHRSYLSSSENWYSFYAYSGTHYYIWNYDTDYDSSSYSVDTRISAYYSDNTSIFTSLDTQYRDFYANRTGYVYIRVTPYYSGSTGYYAIAYSTSSIRP